MQFSIVALFTLAAVAAAAPSVEVKARSAMPLGRRNVFDAAQTCGSDKVVACCNQSNEVDADRGILSGLLDNLITLSCTAVQIPILSTGDTTADNSCPSGSAVKCCEGNPQTGKINVDAQCS